MSISGIQGQLLEVTVVSCSKLKDTEWFSRQDPYVCLDYAGTKVRTLTCTDGGRNPSFQHKFLFNLIEGLKEINVTVWNSNTIATDDFIGSGKIHLVTVLSRGFDDCSCSLQTKSGRYAGEVRVIMHYANANKPATNCAQSAPPYGSPTMPPAAPYYTPPPAAFYTPPAPYPAPHSYSPYPPNATAYPPSPYHSQPPPAYPGPPSPYSAPPYPPSPYDPSYYRTGPHPGAYPPPPY